MWGILYVNAIREYFSDLSFPNCVSFLFDYQVKVFTQEFVLYEKFYTILIYVKCCKKCEYFL